MNPNQFDLWIFDLDGTLIDSFNDLAHSVNILRSEIGLDKKPPGEIIPNIGQGVRYLLSRSIADTELPLEDLLPKFRAIYSRHLLDNTCLFPDADRLLQILKNAGKQTAILTNKPFDFSARIIQGLKINHWIDRLIGGDSLPSLKPSPDAVFILMDYFRKIPQETVMVGDSDIDIDTCRGAGIASIIVGDKNTRLKPDFHFNSYTILIDKFKR